MTKPKSERDLWVEMSIREISKEGHFADIAYNNIQAKGAVSTDIVFSSIHSFLSHCAMISKLLEASEPGGGATIGAVLRVPSSSPIHKRKFRNSLEHYDERLKDWI